MGHTTSALLQSKPDVSTRQHRHKQKREMLPGLRQECYNRFDVFLDYTWYFDLPQRNFIPGSLPLLAMFNNANIQQFIKYQSRRRVFSPSPGLFFAGPLLTRLFETNPPHGHTRKRGNCEK